MPRGDLSQDYDEQQKALRQQAGLGEETEIGEDAPVQIPEVNPEIYRDVESLIFQGFLTLPAEINDINFVFKSLNHHEFNQLGMMHNSDGSLQSVQRYYDLFLSYGVLMVDGVNILRDRDAHIGELQEFFSKLTRTAKQQVVLHMSAVNRRAKNAVHLTEAYSVEPRSRFRWGQIHNLDMTSTAVTGFHGTATLGMNWGQLTWRALNYYEDLREEAERQWENAKFTASAMAGKGMSKIHSSDKRRRQSELQDKMDMRDRVLRHVLLGTPLDAPQKGGNVTVPRTVEELRQQVEADFKGERDFHDNVIADHEEKLRLQSEEKVAYYQQLRDEHIQQYGDQAVLTGKTIVGLTPEQVAERVRKHQAQREAGQASLTNNPELSDAKYAAFADKWVHRKPIVSPRTVMPTSSPDRPRSKPFGGKT